MKGIRCAALIALLAAAGCAGANLPTYGPGGPRGAAVALPGAFSQTREVARRLPGRWERSRTGFQFAPGIEYNSRSLTDDSGNEIDLEFVGFGMTNYVDPVPVNRGPVFLESLLSQSSWWAAFAGPATMETATDDYSGRYVRVEALAMGSNGLGARAGYTYADTMDHELEFATAQFALFYGYMPGGRVGARICDEDLEVLVLVPLVTSSVVWGADWMHVFELGGGGAVGFRYEWSRREHSYGDPEPNEVHKVGGVYYPVREFGINASGAWARGDQEDSDEWSVGLAFDLEQVGLTAEFTRRTRSAPTSGTDDLLMMKLEMRF